MPYNKNQMSLFSPTAYKKAGLLTDRTNSSNRTNGVPARKRRSSAMDMLFAAHTESTTERNVEADAALARNLHHQNAKAHQHKEEKRRKAEEQSEQYAQKLQLEEHDGALAERLHDLERRRAEKEEERRLEDEKLSMEAAKKMQTEEEKEEAKRKKELQKIAYRDAKTARKVHVQHVKEIKREEMQKRKEEQRRFDSEKLSENVAKKLQTQDERAAARERKAKERRATEDAKLARKFHQNELKYIKLDEKEEQRKLAIEKKETEKKEKMDLKSQEIARQMQEEEHRAWMKSCENQRKQHEEDERMAREMQGEELGDVATRGNQHRESWSNPEVDIEETKSGAVITVQLPNVRRMEVDLDEELNIIFVNAIPKSADRVVARLTDDKTHDELKRIVESQFVGALKPVSFEIKLVDIVEGLVTAEDIVSEYRAESGLLRLELTGVVAKSKVEQKEFKSGLLSRLGSLFKRKSKSNKK